MSKHDNHPHPENSDSPTTATMLDGDTILL